MNAALELEQIVKRFHISDPKDKAAHVKAGMKDAVKKYREGEDDFLKDHVPQGAAAAAAASTDKVH